MLHLRGSGSAPPNQLKPLLSPAARRSTASNHQAAPPLAVRAAATSRRHHHTFSQYTTEGFPTPAPHFRRETTLISSPAPTSPSPVTARQNPARTLPRNGRSMSSDGNLTPNL